ncbi:MAG: hypothetical protein MUE61_08530 [Vicinamibacterales bacterium]|jgi:hypothetical protein|nr:hypothetical protein [Vicinamibacterales bacterium]MCU0477209.1 hypothetical protein [Chloroflexota bacterium]MCU0562355.1 hypothetical protein [Desulfobacterales bacterium]
MKPRGIPIAQFDSNLEGDPKFVILRMKAPDRYYAALGTYTSIALRAWATASPDPDGSHLSLMDPVILALLRDCGLLDEDFAIPLNVFLRWPGAVIEARQERAEQLASIASEGGKARARGPRDSAGRLISPAVTAGHPAVTAGHPAVSPLLSSIEDVDVEKNDGAVDGEGVQGEGDDPVQTYYLLTTRMPRGNALDWCKRLGDEYGFASTSAAMIAAWREQDDIRSLLSRTEDALVASARAAELREKAEEKQRLREKRAGVRLPPVNEPDPTKVAAVMAEIKETLHRGARE